MSIIRVKITPKIANIPHRASNPNIGLIGQNGNLHILHVNMTYTSKKIHNLTHLRTSFTIFLVKYNSGNMLITLLLFRLR
ncbi:hypothetical protein ES703_61652 [subsurface metagenome]